MEIFGVDILHVISIILGGSAIISGIYYGLRKVWATEQEIKDVKEDIKGVRDDLEELKVGGKKIADTDRHTHIEMFKKLNEIEVSVGKLQGMMTMMLERKK